VPACLAAFQRRDVYDARLVALFLDATFIAVRPNGPQEGVQVAWGFTEDGERILLSVSLGMRESFADWQSLGRDLINRGLGAPMLIVADGAPGLTKAIEQCWPASDRQRCCVHRARNLYAKLPDRERERVKHAYWQALDEAISEQDAKRRLQALVDQLDTEGYTAAARCLADDLDALVVHLRYPLRHRRRWRSTDESVKCWSGRSGQFLGDGWAAGVCEGREIDSCGVDAAVGAFDGQF
jgi:putative transposase